MYLDSLDPTFTESSTCLPNLSPLAYLHQCKVLMDLMDLMQMLFLEAWRDFGLFWAMQQVHNKRMWWKELMLSKDPLCKSPLLRHRSLLETSEKSNLLVESYIWIEATCWLAIQCILSKNFLQAAIAPKCICQLRTVERDPAIIPICLNSQLPLRAKLVIISYLTQCLGFRSWSLNASRCRLTDCEWSCWQARWR